MSRASNGSMRRPWSKRRAACRHPTRQASRRQGRRHRSARSDEGRHRRAGARRQPAVDRRTATECSFDAKRGLSLGALVTLARDRGDARVRRRYPALAEAAAHAATPQVRNAATIGGNLLQRPRCWYFRNELVPRPRDDEAARSRAASISITRSSTTQRTAMVHASTPATALLAYGARCTLTGQARQDAHGGAGRISCCRRISTRPRHDASSRDEVLTRVTRPGVLRREHARRVPQADRARQLRLADLRRRGACCRWTDTTVAAASIVLGWVAPTPRRAAESERGLVGNRFTEALAREAAKAAVAGATPLVEEWLQGPDPRGGGPPNGPGRGRSLRPQ